MKKFFWYKYYQSQKRKSRDAELYKSLALAKKITIPQRKFMGSSE